MLDFIRIACAVPPVCVGDIAKNTAEICRKIAEADEKGTDLLVFPELALTGYTCGDLLQQEALLRATEEALAEIALCTKTYPALTIAVGLPLCLGGLLYNCAAVVSDGAVCGIVPKTYLANHSEFSERRWFASAQEMCMDSLPAKEIGQAGDYEIPVGNDLIFTLGDGARFGVELCEDLWAPLPPSTVLTLHGAEVVVNLSASNETLGKCAERHALVCHQSKACNCIYAFVSSGYTESTSDTVFSGHSLICEQGSVLAENKALQTDYLLVCDADLGKIRSENRKDSSLRDAYSFFGSEMPVCTVETNPAPLRADGRRYPVNKAPFLPKQNADCLTAFALQARSLAQRLKLLGANAVLGVSGGMDSTLALLVAVEAMRLLGRPATDVHGITMPCFGTTDRTYQNALALMKTLGITQKEIPIKNAVLQHFSDIGQDKNVHDATYENAQARERTQILMDYAGIHKGIVVGTGDLSELALGWCTYNGDHMSMYGVNASVPKTLIQKMLTVLASEPAFEKAKAYILDVVETPISPELLPPDACGKIAQCTEDLVGPYVLHDFFLYHMLRFGFAPKKIYALACRAFAGEYDDETIKKWLTVFYRRFFTQQFKRNCMPDGAKITEVCLNPHGDFKMPSDACGRLWISEAEKL